MIEDEYIVWGAGGHAKVVTDIIRARDAHASIVYVDNDPQRIGQNPIPGGGPIEWEQEDFFSACSAQEIEAKVVLAVGANRVRLDTYRRLEREVHMPTLTHPTSSQSPSATLGHATHICPGVVIHPSVIVGSAVILNTSSIIEHDCRISDGCHISPGAVLAGGVSVGETSWIGAGATVINNVTIGSGSIVGAGAVVIEDIPDNVTVVGNPARIVKRR